MKDIAKVYCDPIAWVQVSGFDIERDAQWAAGLATQAQRRREIWRLSFHHGQSYSEEVAERARAIYNSKRRT